MNIAVIPARGGSKRIPRKNIKDFCGKPMIAWSIEAAKASGCFDRIIISTDDAEIAEVACAWGAEVPFMRPTELADDYTGTIEVVAHAVKWCMDSNLRPQAICCLYATAPFVQIEDIKTAYNVLEQESWSFVFTATEFASPIFRSFQQLESGGVEMFFPEQFAMRSQDLPKALHDAGQFYWGRPDSWLSHKRIFDHHSFPLVIPRWRVQDIDTDDDWLRAELIYQAIFQNNTLYVNRVI